MRVGVALGLLVVMTAGGRASAQDQRGFRGVWNGWDYDAMTRDLEVWRVTMQASGSDHRFKFDDGSWSGNEWSFGYEVPLATIVTAYPSQPDDSSVNATPGRHYTFAMENVNYGDPGQMIIQETENEPVMIEQVAHSVNGETVTIDITLSDEPSTGELVYLRYSLDNWDHSAFTLAEGHGTNRSASIVHDLGDAGKTCSYYVFTTTVGTPTHADADLQTLRWNNNEGANFSYVVESGSAPETPTQQATTIEFANVTDRTLTLSWHAGNGTRRLVLGRESAAINTHPADETGYAADSQFGQGDELGTGNFVLYDGTASSVGITGLEPETTYQFRVYEFNGTDSSARYNTTSASGNPATVTTLAALPYELYINEVMASNRETIQDEDGDWPDWVELYNASADPVHLEGWGLSDNYSNPFKWAFGDVTIGPGEFLIVWASGKDRPAVTNGNQLHTSWSISAAGEEVILTTPDGVRVDELPPTPIPTDVSYGRQPDGSDTWLFFTEPTPGAPNTTQGTPGFLELPAFSIEGGMFTSQVTLDIITDDPGAQIRYTTDGSEPTASSPVFSGPITLDSRAGTPNTISEIPTNYADPYDEYREGWLPPAGEVFKIHTIRARLFKDGYLPGQTVTHSYLIDPAGANRYSLPVISIATDASGLFDQHHGIYVPENYWHSGSDWERPGSIEFFEKDGSLGFSGNIGIRTHGGTTRSRPRKSLRIYARGPSTFNYQLFPDKNLDSFETFILRNGGNDWGDFIFRDLFMQSLLAHTDLDRQYGRPVILFINGEYWGIHNLRERFDDGYIEHHYGLDEHEFVQFESTFDHDWYGSGLPHYDRGNTDLHLAYKELHDYIRDHGVTSPGNYDHVKDLMDVDSFMDFYQAHIFFGNTDWPGNNIRIWRSVEANRSPGAPWRHDGRLRFMTFDTDFGFGLNFVYVPGSYSYDGYNPFGTFAQHNTLAFAANPHETSFSNAEHHTIMFRRMLENDDFREQFIVRFSDQLNTAFSRAAVTNALAEWVAIVGPEMDEHVHRWRQPWDWANELQSVNSYAQQRTANVRGHMQSFFGLGSSRTVTLDVNDPERGGVIINTADGALPTYPWEGSYFSDYPVMLTAVPQPGNRFVGWLAETIEAGDQTDDSSNYDSGWFDGSNGGEGFGAWNLNSSPSGDSGHFLGSSSHPIHSQSPDGRSFGIFAHEAQYADQWANANRAFSDGALQEGESFSILLGISAFSGNKGLIMMDGEAERFRFAARRQWANDHYIYEVNQDGEVSLNTTFSPEADSVFHFTITRGSGNNHTVTIKRGEDTFEETFDLEGPVANLRLYNAFTANSNEENNLFFNLLKLERQDTSSDYIILSEDYYSTNDTISVSMDQSRTLTATFEPMQEETSALLHYWNFNDTNQLLNASYTLGGAFLQITPGGHTVVTHATGQDFFGENARFGDEAGVHLRVNDPLGAVMTLDLPTTDYENIILMYETRRSGQGAGTQIIEYTLNGHTYATHSSITTENDTPVLHTFDFSSISGANDNPDFGVRITFMQGAGGLSGNNRFDNLTLEGNPQSGANSPPVYDNPVPLQEIIEDGTHATVDLNNVYTDPDGDPMTFTATSDNTDAVTVSLSGSTLTLNPVGRGEATISLTATDNINPVEVPGHFRVLVYPEAHVLEDGNFSFGTWDPDTPEKTYPAHMLFLQSDQSDTALDTPLLHAYHIAHDDYHNDDQGTIGFPYNNTGRSRINGLNDDGIAFINTGSGRDLGGALLALDTRNVTDAPIAWLAGTLLANSREYAIRLQYRVGTDGPWSDLLDDNEQPVEYVRMGDGHTRPMPPVTLPPEALGEEYVQLLWRYYRISGESGPRAQLRLDDILVANSLVLPATALEFSSEPVAFWQSGRTLPAISVHAVDENGLLDSEFDGPISLTLVGDGTLGGTTNISAVNGVATFTDVVVTGIGTNRLRAASGALSEALSSQLSFSDITALHIPQYIQGEQDLGGNNLDRIPFAFRASIDGLLPDATYRYGNRVVLPHDDETADGAGNMIFVRGTADHWVRNTSSPRFEPGDYTNRYYEFTTDSQGTYTGWFITEPTGNARFTPGNTLHMRIILNNGQNGEYEQHYLTLPDEVTVIRFGSQANEATGVMSQTSEAEKNFVFLYDNTAGSGRPLAGVPIEITGSEVDDRYATFYEQTVSAIPQLWGTLIPNTLPNGVRRIEFRALSDGAVTTASTYADGIPETIHPSSGLDAIVLDAQEGTPEFLPPADGTWNQNANWSTGLYPDGIGAEALVGPRLTGDRDVQISAPVTIGHLTVNNADSTNRNRIVATGLGNALTFNASPGPAELTILGSGSGFVEFRSDDPFQLDTDLRITITNLNEKHGVEGVHDDDYGALRFRDDWTGPGGLIKTGPGVMSLTGSGKNYTGATVIEEGVLRVTEPASPANSSFTAVHPGGQLRLVSDGDRIYPFGGPLMLDGMGRGGDVPIGQELGILGALRYDPGSNDNRAELNNEVNLVGPTSLHVDGTRNEMALSGTLSGPGSISKSGGGTLTLSGNNESYTMPITVSSGVLRVDGQLGSSVSLETETYVRGSGEAGALGGSGTVSPGPGAAILRATSVAGLNYQFLFTQTGAPDYGNAASSGNDLLRLDDSTPLLGSFNQANRIDLFFDVASFHSNNVFSGGFFTHQQGDFLEAIENADWHFHLRDAEGSIEHDGQTYAPYGGPLTFVIETIPATAAFADGTVEGRIMRIRFAEAGETATFNDWQEDHFSPEELANPAISGPTADPDNTGIANLMRYALGLGRHDPHEDARPAGLATGTSALLRHRRLLDPEDNLHYTIQVRPSVDEGTWQNAIMDTHITLHNTTPTGDGLTEYVDYIILEPFPKFFRLAVTQAPP